MTVFDYHQRSKHRLDGYARGPDTIDWDAQPDVFRRFDGAPIVELPLSGQKPSLPFAALCSPATIPVQPPTLATLSSLLEHSLALSAWKQYGSSRWSLRCNPSSGNLHPTEAYLLLAGIGGDELDDGLYHYRADLHGLEQRCRFDNPLDSAPDAKPELLIGLSSVHWREAWKYGERGYRYCQHDIGHAVAAISYSAAMLGWQVARCAGIGDQQLAALLGLDRAEDFIAGEEECPDLLLRVVLPSAAEHPLDEWLRAARTGAWCGKAAVLDRKHFYQWPVIDEVQQAAQKPETAVVAEQSIATAESCTDWPPPLPGRSEETASRLIRQRRSAQAFDGYSPVSQSDFFVLLDHLLPRPELPPWSALGNRTALHCVFFLHRVEGLPPGLYAFPRSQSGEALMRQQLRAEFGWQPVEQAPKHLPFYQLVQARCERAAAQLSCQQAIAGDSAFSLGMLAEFEASIAEHPWRYRELFWEAGAIGQVLYLEAEAVGLRGTGIGCFFDDGVHDLLGIQGQALQSLYHFTVGGALNDARIVSLPPYSARR